MPPRQRRAQVQAPIAQEQAVRRRAVASVFEVALQSYRGVGSVARTPRQGSFVGMLRFARDGRRAVAIEKGFQGGLVRAQIRDLHARHGAQPVQIRNAVDELGQGHVVAEEPRVFFVRDDVHREIVNLDMIQPGVFPENGQSGFAAHERDVFFLRRLQAGRGERFQTIEMLGRETDGRAVSRMPDRLPSGLYRLKAGGEATGGGRDQTIYRLRLRAGHHEIGQYVIVEQRAQDVRRLRAVGRVPLQMLVRVAQRV